MLYYECPKNEGRENNNNESENIEMKTSRQLAKEQSAQETARQAAIMEAKIAGTYVSGAMTASVEVEAYVPETVTQSTEITEIEYIGDSGRETKTHSSRKY